MAAVLNFTQNALSNIISGYTTLSGIQKNSKVDTKIMCSYSVEKNINFFHLAQMAAILDFAVVRHLKNNFVIPG